jgi:ABC-2 type transport system ATP-binding protein
MIAVQGLTKRYGRTTAVDRLSFEVRPGQVTGFLGPNGAGKSTTMRVIMGLDAPDTGRAAIGGRAYHQLRWPLREVGAMLEARSFHPGRTGRSHLRALAAATTSGAQVEEECDVVGCGWRATSGHYSRMAQRLGVRRRSRPGQHADEPVTGWTRKASGGSGLLGGLAAQGRRCCVQPPDHRAAAAGPLGHRPEYCWPDHGDRAIRQPRRWRTP